jgi:hypothetical protein
VVAPNGAAAGGEDPVLRGTFQGGAILAGVWSRSGGLLYVCRGERRKVKVKVSLIINIYIGSMDYVVFRRRDRGGRDCALRLGFGRIMRFQGLREI